MRSFPLDEIQALLTALGEQLARARAHVELVVIGARVSKSASATPQAGDLQGFSKQIKVGATGVAVVIDQVVP